jgi:hypothetical protein
MGRQAASTFEPLDVSGLQHPTAILVRGKARLFKQGTLCLDNAEWVGYLLMAYPLMALAVHHRKVATHILMQLYNHVALMCCCCQLGLMMTSSSSHRRLPNGVQWRH